mgnify:CR=1 FL=1
MPIFWGLEDVQELQSNLTKGEDFPTLTTSNSLILNSTERLMHVANGIRAEWVQAEKMIKVGNRY